MIDDVIENKLEIANPPRNNSGREEKNHQISKKPNSRIEIKNLTSQKF